MLKTVLRSFKTTLSVLLGAALLGACESDSDGLEPMPVAGPVHTNFSLVDSIQMDAIYRNSYPVAYEKWRGKTYQVATQNKLEAYFMEEDNGVTLYFRDTSTVNSRSWVSLHFKNRQLVNLPATLSLKDNAVVCVTKGQTFPEGGGAMSPDCEAVLDGTATLYYNATTQTLSGTLTHLKFGLEFFVPEYSFPNREGIALKNSGSTRNLNITFENLKARKSD